MTPDIPGLRLRVHEGGSAPAAQMAAVAHAARAADGIDELVTTAELEHHRRSAAYRKPMKDA